MRERLAPGLAAMLWRLKELRQLMLEDEGKALNSQSAPAPLAESSRRLDVCLHWQLHALHRSQAGRFEVGDQLFWKMRQHTKLMNVDSLASPSAPKMLAGTIPKLLVRAAQLVHCQGTSAYPQHSAWGQAHTRKASRRFCTFRTCVGSFEKLPNSDSFDSGTSSDVNRTTYLQSSCSFKPT